MIPELAFFWHAFMPDIGKSMTLAIVEKWSSQPYSIQEFGIAF